MKITKNFTILLFSLLLPILLSSCSLFQLEYADFRYTEPSDYYLYTPPNYTGETAWPVFIFVGSIEQSGRDCMRSWTSIAEENEFILLCPILTGADGGWIQSEGEDKVASILSAVSETHLIRSKSFITGFSAGAQFAMGYTFSYPNFVSGTSLISTGNSFPINNLNAVRVPFLITIGELDPNRIDLADTIYTNLTKAGFNASYYILDDVAHELSPAAINLTMQLFNSVNP